jgi:hypothetical protein
MKHIKSAFFFTLAMAIILSSTAMAQGQGRGNGSGNCPIGAGGTGNFISTLPNEELSEAEIAGMRYMREEEKLARDVYLSLYETWNDRIFDNIARSEQRHMDAVKALLDKYGLDDPMAEERGVFNDADLQVLYDNLLEKGTLSLGDALNVGATIEDLDIFDLDERLAQADNADIQTVFQNLKKGSRNHLRAFVFRLGRLGETYNAQYLSAEELEAILNSPRERGSVDENGESLFNGRGGRGRWTNRLNSVENLFAKGGHGPGDGTGSGGSGPKDGTGNGAKKGTCNITENLPSLFAKGGHGPGDGTGNGGSGPKDGTGNGAKKGTCNITENLPSLFAKGGHGPGDGTGNGGSGLKDGTGNGAKKGTCIG